MKLYKAEWIDPDLGTCMSWHGSRREAEQALKKMQEGRRAYYADNDIADDDCDSDVVEKIEIPTDKAGLIAWLNSNLTSDNG